MRKLASGTEIKEPQTEEEKKNRMRLAAEMLYDDYLNDPELTAFTNLDGEEFLTSCPNPIARI